MRSGFGVCGTERSMATSKHEGPCVRLEHLELLSDESLCRKIRRENLTPENSCSKCGDALSDVSNLGAGQAQAAVPGKLRAREEDVMPSQEGLLPGVGAAFVYRGADVSPLELMLSVHSPHARSPPFLPHGSPTAYT